MIEAIKRETVKQVADLSHNSTAFLMAGLGISAVAFNEFVGGVFLAGFWASVIAKRRNDARKVWMIWVTAAGAAIFVAQFWPIGWLPQWIPVQAAMSIIGGLSSALVNMVIRLSDHVETRATNIADRLIDKVLPDDDGSGNK